MRTPPTVTNSHNTQTHSPIHIRHKALSMLQTVYIHHPLHHAHTPRIHNPSLPPFPLLTHPCHNLLQSTLRLIAHHIPPNTTKPLPIPNCTLTPPFFAETLRHTFLRILIHNPPLIPLLPRQNTKHPIRLHLPQFVQTSPILLCPLPSLLLNRRILTSDLQVPGLTLGRSRILPSQARTPSCAIFAPVASGSSTWGSSARQRSVSI